jgi:DNA-binding transcriptional ArsR family regulator
MTSSAAWDLDLALAAVADPARRRTLELLSQWPRRAGELADLLGLSPPVMSRHLRQLRERGLVDVHTDFDARGRIYTLRLEPFSRLGAWLAEVERRGRLQGLSEGASSLAGRIEST